MPATPERSRQRQALGVAATGVICLAVVMGLGRFAYTPLLPMMLHDGLIDLRQASWLASSNYLGYLLGAMACAMQPWLWARLRKPPQPRFSVLVRAGLVATVLLTLGMAWPLPGAWAALRFAAGLASAVAFIYTAGWCLSQLARLGRPNWGGAMFAGPGAAIALSGLATGAMVAQGWSASQAWLSMAALAALGTLAAWPVLARPASSSERLMTSAAGTDAQDAPEHGLMEQSLLVLGYGLAGFGYIISATFLPVIARMALPNSIWLDLFWPIFGLSVMLGALLSTRLPSSIDRRSLLVACYLMQAAGIGAGLWRPSVSGFVIGSALLGLPFTAISFFAMQEARRLKAGTASGFMGLLTATYGLGQVLGPLLVAELLHHTSAARGFDLSLGTAAASMLLGAGLFAWMLRRYPLR